MNVLLRLRKDMPITGLVPFKYLLYLAMLSKVVPHIVEEEETKYGIFDGVEGDLYDYYPDWDDADDRKSEVLKALNDLTDEGLIWFDEEDNIYLGEYRGKKFFPFEAENSLYDNAVKKLDDAIKRYGKSKSAKDKSRARYIREQIDKLIDRGVENLTPINFTDLHGYLYEIYTGGEIYIIRGKAEHFQTNNMLKAYDKFTVFSLIVEATLEYDKYRKRGVPTLTNVACMKDDVFKALTKPDEGSKDYMREMTSSVSEDSEF